MSTVRFPKSSRSASDSPDTESRVAKIQDEQADSYARYQHEFARRHLIQRLHDLQVRLDLPVLDVGCGVGGGTMALAQSLPVPVTGVDISEDSIRAARARAADAGCQVRFSTVDVVRDELPDGPFGLILMHDVIEHIHQPRVALDRLRPLVQTGGFLYITFPPWWGPYAGHHHNCESALRFMPYLHAIAPALLLRLAHRWEEKSDDWFADLEFILRNRLTMRGFEAIARFSGWAVRNRTTYLLRPELKRMGLPTVSNRWVGRLPWIGECLTTGCEYLLEPQ